MSAGLSAAGRAASRRGRRAASPAGRGGPRRAPPGPRSRPAAAAPRSARARTGRRRARPRRRLEVRERGLARLVVALDRRPLAEAGDAVVAQLDLDDVVLVARLARDHERFGEAQGDDPGGQLHRRNPNGTGLQKCFAPHNLCTALRHKGENMKRLIVLATGLLAALAVTVAPASAAQASGGELRRLLRLGGRRRGRVRQPRRSDRDGQLGPHGRERAEGAEPVRDLRGAAGQRQGQGPGWVPRERARLDPRDQRRRHGQRPAERHRRADVGLQPRLRRLLRRRRPPASRSRSPASRAPTTRPGTTPASTAIPSGR